MDQNQKLSSRGHFSLVPSPHPLSKTKGIFTSILALRLNLEAHDWRKPGPGGTGVSCGSSQRPLPEPTFSSSVFTVGLSWCEHRTWRQLWGPFQIWRGKIPSSWERGGHLSPLGERCIVPQSWRSAPWQSWSPGGREDPWLPAVTEKTEPRGRSGRGWVSVLGSIKQTLVE